MTSLSQRPGTSRPMNCDFRAYEVCTNFRRGLLQTGQQTGVEPLNLVIIHIMHHFFVCEILSLKHRPICVTIRLPT